MIKFSSKQILVLHICALIVVCSMFIAFRINDRSSDVVNASNIREYKVYTLYSNATSIAKHGIDFKVYSVEVDNTTVKYLGDDFMITAANSQMIVEWADDTVEVYNNASLLKRGR